MDVEVKLDTNGAAAAGVDRAALIADIQAELDKLAKTLGVQAPEQKSQPAPSGAQGDLATIHWLLHVATDPAMAKVYAQGLIYAINSLLSAAQSKKTSAPNTSSKPQTSQESKQDDPVQIKLLGKEFLLPTTSAVIKSILDTIGDK